VNKIGEAIEMLRSAMGIARSDLAEAVGMDEYALTVIELGRKEPTMVSVGRIAGVLGIKTSILVQIAEELENTTRADFVRELIGDVY